ncbi:BnaA02g08360D [Brassica napus]|uniref:BnaA02g08360D protein n=1 Tax=Brassica napus TaxID=3708 RepID=A0A078G5G7_BRANA|nr:BnaA02g08360D [Brassica napus]
MFRSHLPMPFAMQLFPELVRFLGAESNVVHSYAAICIEKLLLLKDEGGRSSRNPKNPTFNHYMFESVAVLVRRACEGDISLITEFDSSLFPRLKMILADDVREFIPYAFQLLAQLVELNIQPISPDYMEMFLLLLAPNPNWWRSHQVPALVRLLQAILQKAPHEVTQKNLLGQVLGVFDKLVKTPSTVEQGCYVLNTVIEYMEYGVIAPYMTFVWSSLFTNLQQKKSVELQKCLVIFISLFLVKHGPANLVDTMNAVQRNIFIAILPRQDSYVRLQPFSIQQLLMSLVSRPEQERAIDEPEMPEISDNTATFVNLYNVGRREVDPLQDITDPKQFFVTSLAMLSASHPGRYPWVIRYNLEKANQDALIKLCTAYNCAIV